MNNRPLPTRSGRLVTGFVLCVVCLISAGNLLANELAVPAEYVRDIKMPGIGETILRPSSLHFDRFYGEILVGDPGNNRIVIFGANGVFNFSFSLTGIMTTPRDITTDPRGFIYVLGSDPRGQVLFRFDFDGAPLNPIEIPSKLKDVNVELRNLACDDQGTLYALDHLGRRVLVFGDDDTVVNSINLERDMDVAALVADGAAGGEGAYALGTMSIAKDVLYIPVSNVGTVHTYSTDGEFLGSVGHFGSKPGTLNFPVAVEVSPEGLIMVLDRTRYCVVCFSPDNKFLGEFGGRGVRPGWFMGPSLLSVPSADRAIVGQVFRNKIQVCSIPEFIRAKVDPIQSEQAATTPDISGVDAAVRKPVVMSQRRLSENSRPIPQHDGEFPPSESTLAPEAQTVSYPEVSE